VKDIGVTNIGRLFIMQAKKNGMREPEGRLPYDLKIRKRMSDCF
jgi:hypothetical protein